MFTIFFTKVITIFFYGQQHCHLIRRSNENWRLEAREREKGQTPFNERNMSRVRKRWRYVCGVKLVKRVAYWEFDHMARILFCYQWLHKTELPRFYWGPRVYLNIVLMRGTHIDRSGRELESWLEYLEIIFILNKGECLCVTPKLQNQFGWNLEYWYINSQMFRPK